MAGLGCKIALDNPGWMRFLKQVRRKGMMYTNKLNTCTQSYLTGLCCQIVLVDPGLDLIVERSEKDDGADVHNPTVHI
jgi:hypothetical protein